MIRCACLVKVASEKLLLIQVRSSALWYLPGGKIEPGELPQHALIRELREELGVTVDPASVAYLYTVVGPAYGNEGDVELVCFAADWPGEAKPHAEITGLEWVGFDETYRIAPAVRLLIGNYLATRVTDGVSENLVATEKSGRTAR